MNKRQRKKHAQKQWFRDAKYDIREYLKGNWTQMTVTDEKDVYFVRFANNLQVKAEFVCNLGSSQIFSEEFLAKTTGSHNQDSLGTHLNPIE
jgi:hypothetical protein